LIFLRYGTRQIPLRTGEFLIGRSVECHLVLDDDLTSRRHARIRIKDQQASVEDLRSTNGVLINGHRISGAARLGNGDRILVGRTEFAIEMTVSAPPWPQTAIEICEADTQDLSDALDAADMLTDAVPEGEVTGRQDMLTILGAVADKSLAMGQPDHAERVLSVFLKQMLSEAKAGRAAPPVDIERADHFCVKLARATSKGEWVNHIFELHEHARQLVPGPVIDELLSVVRKVNQLDGASLRRYLEVMAPQAAHLTPSQKFLLQRAEALGRVIAAK
jgi:hypothetical protein